MSHSRATGLSRIPAEAGVTLPELTIVVVIIALGAMMATPVYLEWVARAELRQGTVELTSTLSLARMAAMNRNQTTQVDLTLVGSRVQITTGGLMGPQPMGNSVTGFTGGPVQFSSLGLRLGGGAGDQLITLTNGRGQVYSVRVTPAGKANWCPKSTCP